ncbi:allantoate permease [Thozetella sp. PMI_491]|nr:allantoate permease [Thozetella sp. PMI_491]
MDPEEKIESQAAESSAAGVRVDTEAQKLINPSDVDAALEYLSRGAARPMTEEEEKKLVRKIDWRIVPLMWACYCLQFLDKVLINYANVMDLQQDAGLVGNQFSQLALIFYVTYLVSEFPSGFLMQRLPTAKFLGANVVIWGAIVALTSATKNFAGLVTLRALLGCFEASVAPALILITAMWYKHTEQPPRVGLWYLGTGTGPIIGSLASYGFQHYHSSTFTSWQIMFLVFGLATVVVGIMVILVLPDNPMMAKFLTEEEKKWAIERLRENRTGVENKHFKWHQVVECFSDPQTWLICIITCSSSVPNGAVSSFQGAIIQGFGYTSMETALLSLPSGLMACFSIITATWLAGHFKMRGPFIIIYLLLGGIIGGSLLAFSPADNKAAKLAGNYLTNCIGSSLPLLYSYASANFAGHTKKVTMNALLLISFCLGNVFGPLSFQDKDKPDYIPAKITIVLTCSLSCLCVLALMAYYHFENQRRDQRMSSITHQENSEFFDLTDRQNPEFRYRW